MRGIAEDTQEAQTPEFELQEVGRIRRGILLTREGDERDEIDVLRVVSTRGDNVIVKSDAHGTGVPMDTRSGAHTGAEAGVVETQETCTFG